MILIFVIITQIIQGEILSNPSQMFWFSSQINQNSSILANSTHPMDEFSNYVYNLVKKRNPEKTVLKSSIHIVIQDENSNESLFLYPRLTKINSIPEIDAKEDINFAISLLENNECKNIYLLFPKTKTFTRQVPVRSERLDNLGIDYNLKLIPYKMDQKNCKSCKERKEKCA